MTTLLNIGLILPTRGAPGSGIWDDALDACLLKLDNHSHVTGDGVPIATAALNINADLPFHSFAATGVKAIKFTQVASGSMSTYPGSFYLADDDEYYVRKSTGTPVKLTNGNGLNMSLLGGIVGDYAAASAALYYDDTAEAYRLLEAAPGANSWSYLKAGGFDLYQHAIGIATFIGLRSPSALAASYNLTLPGALPSATAVLQVSTAGLVTFSTTEPDLGHGDRVASACVIDGLYDGSLAWDTSNVYAVSSAAGAVWKGVAFRTGDRIKTATATIRGNSVCIINVELLIVKADGATVFSINAGDIPDGNWTTSTPGAAIGYALVAGDAVYVHVSMDGTGGRVKNVAVTYDHPHP